MNSDEITAITVSIIFMSTILFAFYNIKKVLKKSKHIFEDPQNDYKRGKDLDEEEQNFIKKINKQYPFIIINTLLEINNKGKYRYNTCNFINDNNEPYVQIDITNDENILLRIYIYYSGNCEVRFLKNIDYFDDFNNENLMKSFEKVGIMDN